MSQLEVQNVDFQALGLTYEEYLQIINCPDTDIIEKAEEQVIKSDESSSLEEIVNKEEAEKEAKELEASRQLIRDMLISEGESPERIEEIIASLNKSPIKNNQEQVQVPDESKSEKEEEEEKFDGEELERLYKAQEAINKLPPTMKALFDCLSLADKQKFLQEIKEQKESMDYINQVLAQDYEEDETLQIKEEKESEEYIKALIEEEEKQRDQQDEAMEGDCPICLDSLFSQAVFPLSNCGHLFHIDCLETYVIEEIKKRTFPIKCPNPDCKAEIPEDDVKDTLQAHIEYQDIYDEYYIKSYVDSHPTEFFQCPTPDCKFICSVEGARFDCPDCEKNYCVECKVEWHHNMSCKQFQEQKKGQTDEAFEQYAGNMKYMRCPKCKVYVERIEGCNAMSCTRCRTQFCYECGKEGDGHVCNHIINGVDMRPHPLPGIRPFPGIRPLPMPHVRPMVQPRPWRRPDGIRRPYLGRKANNKAVVNPKIVNIEPDLNVNLERNMQKKSSVFERNK